MRHCVRGLPDRVYVIDGELPTPKLPLVPGHEIVGTVAALGDGVSNFILGERVGVPWLGWTCGECEAVNWKGLQSCGICGKPRPSQ